MQTIERENRKNGNEEGSQEGTSKESRSQEGTREEGRKKEVIAVQPSTRQHSEGDA
jgi:hypothetical protein